MDQLSVWTVGYVAIRYYPWCTSVFEDKPQASRSGRRSPSSHTEWSDPGTAACSASSGTRWSARSPGSENTMKSKWNKDLCLKSPAPFRTTSSFFQTIKPLWVCYSQTVWGVAHTPGRRLRCFPVHRRRAPTAWTWPETTEDTPAARRTGEEKVLELRRQRNLIIPHFRE